MRECRVRKEQVEVFISKDIREKESSTLDPPPPDTLIPSLPPPADPLQNPNPKPLPR